MTDFTPLPDGGTIAIIAPSSRGQPDLDGVSMLEKRGFKVKVHAQNFLTDNQSAGSTAQRAMALSEVFSDPGIHAVMAARGGNRSMHTLPLMDLNFVKNNPKPFIGFSDSTALANAIYARTGVTAFHGPTLSRITKSQPHELDQMIAALQGRPCALAWDDAMTLNGGTVTGPMVGGNLSMMASLCGTPYMPDTHGAILFLEDIGDQLSRYDRMLAQLRLAGVFDNIGGLIFGRMIAQGDSSVTPFGFTTEDIIAEHTKDLNVPVVINAPFGHSGPLCTLPVGGKATLDADALTLTF